MQAFLLFKEIIILNFYIINAYNYNLADLMKNYKYHLHPYTNGGKKINR